MISPAPPPSFASAEGAVAEGLRERRGVREGEGLAVGVGESVGAAARDGVGEAVTTAGFGVGAGVAGGTYS